MQLFADFARHRVRSAPANALPLHGQHATFSAQMAAAVRRVHRRTRFDVDSLVDETRSSMKRAAR
jgi:hypothetical protein